MQWHESTGVAMSLAPSNGRYGWAKVCYTFGHVGPLTRRF